MEALGRSGHFAQIVIADGNLPVGAMSGPNSTTVHLNFRPGMLDAIQVLEGILTVCPIQGATVMQKPAEANAEIHECHGRYDKSHEEDRRYNRSHHDRRKLNAECHCQQHELKTKHEVPDST